MKTWGKFKTYILIGFLGCLSLIVLQRCTIDDQKSATYQKTLNFIDGVKVINTHEHQHRPEEYGLDTLNFYHLLHGSYLIQDILVAGGQRLDMYPLDTIGLEAGWDKYGTYLNYTRNTSYYGHFVKGFQKLYDFNDIFFTENNISALSPKIIKNYSNYSSWFDTAFKKAGFELMFLDQYWNSFNVNIDTNYYALVFHVNQLVLQANHEPSSGKNLNSIYKKAEEDNFIIKTFDDYLAYCDYLFKRNVENNAVAVKSSLAYTGTLTYKEVSYETARAIFIKSPSSITEEENIAMRSYMFHWIIKKAISYNLPIQIHTGYLAGDGGNYLKNSNPLKLNNLFTKYRNAKFILFHGGYPWTSEFIAMGKMFPNVYLDLVWLPQISREKAVLALDEMLDCIPYNKIFWGGDCAFIEEATGSLEFGKSVVAETLSKRIKRGLLSEDVAYDIIRRIFRENAVEVFKLEEKLEREF
jgi:hypothetical protein